MKEEKTICPDCNGEKYHYVTAGGIVDQVQAVGLAMAVKQVGIFVIFAAATKRAIFLVIDVVVKVSSINNN